MLMTFIGQYTGGRTSVSIGGVVFNGREPSEVPDGSPIIRHPELEAYAEPEVAVEVFGAKGTKPRGKGRKA